MNANRQHWHLWHRRWPRIGWWHLALFHLAQGDDAAALADGRDERLRAADPGDLSALFDAAAAGGACACAASTAGPLAARWLMPWAPHVDDAFCINDLHAMLVSSAHTTGRALPSSASLLREEPAAGRRAHGESARQLSAWLRAAV